VYSLTSRTKRGEIEKPDNKYLQGLLMRSICLKRIVAVLALSSLATAAMAQYVWLDEKGVKQYSDMPPPVSVPKSRILKGAGSMSQPPARTEPAPASGQNDNAGADTSKTAPTTTAEKNADFLKRRAEQAEKEKKDAQQAKLAADNAKNCERVRDYNRALESGERIARRDKNGERAFLSDEERAQEVRDSKRILAECR
jgi:hypothetical protein